MQSGKRRHLHQLHSQDGHYTDNLILRAALQTSQYIIVCIMYVVPFASFKYFTNPIIW